MELKPFATWEHKTKFPVLIVPFMELKPNSGLDPRTRTQRLNRTFYGIETIYNSFGECVAIVLIVPFMELKPGTFIVTMK